MTLQNLAGLVVICTGLQVLFNMFVFLVVLKEIKHEREDRQFKELAGTLKVILPSGLFDIVADHIAAFLQKDGPAD